MSYTNYEQQIKLNKLRRSVVEDCERAIEIASLDKYETSKILEELGKGKDFDPYLLTYNMEFKKSFDEVNNYYKKFCDALIEVAKEVHKRKVAKLETDEKANEEKKKNKVWDKLDEQMKENTDRLKKLSDEMKNKGKNNDQPESPDPKEKPNPNLPKKEEDTFDAKCKREYIEEAERLLKKDSIPDSKLNSALGVSDWRAEINGSSSWRTAQTFSFSINNVVEKLSKQFVCDMCKETASPILDYIVFDKKEGKKKKFCSWECKNSWEDKSGVIDKDEEKVIKKELREIKDYLKKNNNKVLDNLLTWMKKWGAINITLSNDKLVIELSGKKEQVIRESGLTSEQRVVKDLLQRNSGKKSISRSEVEKMVSESYNEERGENKNPNSGNGGIIAVVCVVLVVVIGLVVVVVHKNKKRDY